MGLTVSTYSVPKDHKYLTEGIIISFEILTSLMTHESEKLNYPVEKQRAAE